MEHNYPEISPEEQAFFQEVEVPYAESKEAIWEKLSTQLEAPPAAPKTIRLISRPWFRMSAAAAIGLLVTLTLFAKFSTRTVDCPRGQQLSHTLPDGSQVRLNAESSLSYHPWWWAFDREVRFEGEGFFAVEKGSKFTVSSPQGSTRVLGTSFNIFAREDQYRVFCASGKVSVVAKGSGEEVVLTPNMAVRIQETAVVKDKQEAEPTLSWKEGKLYFQSQPLGEVLAEIERQYDITVQLNAPEFSNRIYTGFFQKPEKAETTLNLICESFGLTFEKMNENSFTILPK